jgi:Leucine-rich repeat (LRR) protein
MLTQLKKLYLSSNKITHIQNVSFFPNLDMLELGANRIRVRS